MTGRAAEFNSVITIRDLQTFEDLSKVEAVEREVWGLADLDILPLTAIIASEAAGHLWIGAFHENELVGFAYGFPSLENGQLKVHSHMLAVREQYRDLNLGHRIKMAQRERALNLKVRGTHTSSKTSIEEMTWTFDPLQSRNAHFNVAKLGVVSDHYRIDFYGPQTSSALHRNSTDRLWVRWPMASRRVRERLQPESAGDKIRELFSGVNPLVSVSAESQPQRENLATALSKDRIAIQIPENISVLEADNAELARQWREASRWAFTESLAAGFFVAEFLRSSAGNRAGTYVLIKGNMDNYIKQENRT
ncbi:MAG: GNAT family N-acetyltransferase [Terriglobales bacterium]